MGLNTLSVAPGTEPSDRILGEQVRALYRTAFPALNVALFGAVALSGVLLYIDAQAPQVVAVWMAFVLADFALRQGLGLMFRATQPALTDWRRWAGRFTVSTLIGGLIWGVGAVYLMTPDSTTQLVIMLFISATASGAVPAFGSYLPATYAYMIPAMVPFVLWSATRGDALHHALALMGLIFVFTFLLLAQRFNANLIASLMLRFENLDLVEDLRRQKEIAEQANVAKSRFLAAASHDLRQPVHALGMFIGALRNRAMDDEAHRLVAHLDGSVDALDSLFVALLDISRLDAGIVQSHSVPFAIQPMLDRVCADHASEAAKKGILLTHHRCSAVVYSDPVLVERILRNLVSNAVRYTGTGRVVVGCRRGRLLRIEVWDTGPGIPNEHHARIFEEFYQLDNFEHDRAKGLGLGLAIVQRLTKLLDCPLTFESVPGKGSVFKFSVPLSEEALPPQSAVAESASPTASSGLILVIDDETAILEAMRSLLSEWGHEVVVAGSCQQMLERIGRLRTRPVLIICDYRLRGAENGIEVIERLQLEFNHAIPAMLITGDTGPERLMEAQKSGFLLLHKPVPRGKLRAAIGNLTGAVVRDMTAR